MDSFFPASALQRSARTLSHCAAFTSALAIWLVAASALAQGPAQPNASTPSTTLTTGSLAREDALTVGSYTCVVGNHAGIDSDDAHTAADVVCHALAAHAANGGVYDISVGKLGGKLLLRVTERASGSERRLFIQGAEEIPVAADRLVAALVENKPIEETATAENVLSSESTTPQQKKVLPGVVLGLTGQSALGTPNTMSAGVEIDMQFRLHNLALLGQGRAGGIGSDNNLLGYASLGLGVRYFITDADVAPFIGGGLMFAYFQDNTGNDTNSHGSGFGGYGELGLAFLRSSHVGGVINLRVDLPAFKLNPASSGYDYTTDMPVPASGSSIYVVPLSLNVGISFQ